MSTRRRRTPRRDRFMAMGTDEWKGLFRSLTSGGVLTPAEDEGYKRAMSERGLT